MACRCFVHNNPAVHREGVLGRDQVFSQDVRGLGVAHVPSYDNSRRKRDRSSARNGTEEGARPTAVDLVHFIAREASSEHHGRRRTCHVAGPRVVVFSVAQSVRALGVGKRKSAPRDMSDAKLPNRFRGRSAGSVREAIERERSAGPFRWRRKATRKERGARSLGRGWRTGRKSGKGRRELSKHCWKV